MDRLGSFTFRIALMFAGLFAGAIGLALLAIQIVIADTAGTNAHRDMAETAIRFEREWASAADMMHAEARMLAKDFGFRRAAATGDAPTVESALANIAGRSGRPLAMFIGADGTVYRAGGLTGLPALRGDALAAALDAGRDSGTLRLGADNYWTVAEAVAAPQIAGWVLFGERLDRRGLASGGFAPPPFMQVYVRHLAGLSEEARRLADKAAPGQPALWADADAVLRIVPLPSLLPGAERQVFMLRFSLQAATAEYRVIAVEVATICLLILLLAVAASWLIARRVSRPINALGAAVDEVMAGRRVDLDIARGDVLGRMARGLSGVSQTISELSHSARHDPLTLLPNRRAFDERAEAALSAQIPAAILLVDLDRFKPVNDTYGHPVGDALLQGVAARLQDTAAQVQGCAARLGGDEFAVLITGERAEARALDFAQHFQRAVQRPIDALGIAVQTGASIGLASTPRDGRRLADILSAADVALYQAKAAGRGRLCRFGIPHMRLVQEGEVEASAAVTGKGADRAAGAARALSR